MKPIHIAALTTFITLIVLGSIGYFVLDRFVHQSWEEGSELKMREFNYSSAVDYNRDHGDFPVKLPSNTKSVDVYREDAMMVARIYTKIKVEKLPSIDKIPAYLGSISPRSSKYAYSYDRRDAPALEFISWWDSDIISQLSCFIDSGPNRQPVFWVNFETNTVYTRYY